MHTDRAGFALVIAVALAFVVSLAVWNFSASAQNQGNQGIYPSSSPSSPGGNGLSQFPAGIQQNGAEASNAITVHSVASVQKTINRTLLLPSAASISAINSSMKLVGVKYDGPPSSVHWMVSIIYSSQPFHNGTTTLGDLLAGGAVYVTESAAPLGVNSSEVAHEQMAQPGAVTICQTTSGANSSSTVLSHTASATGGPAGDYIVMQDGLSILVNPTGTVLWSDGRNGVAVMIGGDNLSSSQLLSISATMT